MSEFTTNLALVLKDQVEDKERWMSQEGFVMNYELSA